jgi:succinate dehydrogenase flavin-adding protein (antitoxin of CptAB toxin-antitoxin module)
MKKKVVLVLAVLLIVVNSYNLYENRDSLNLVKVTGLAFNTTSYVGVRVLSAASAVGFPIFNATRNIDNMNVDLDWAVVENASYDVYYSSNVSLLKNVSQNCTESIPTGVSNFTGLIDTNYTDFTANTTQQRYYRVAAVNGSYCNLSNETWGKFDVEVLAATYTFGTNEIDTLSIPLRPINASFANLLNVKTDWDFVAWYNATKSPDPGFESAYYFSGTWYGSIQYLRPGQGYVFGPITTGSNFTVVGLVPEDNITVEVYTATYTFGTNEIDNIGWDTPLFNCSFNTLLPSSTDWDFVAWYNATKSPDPGFESAYYFSGTWYGSIQCFRPGHGYIFGPITTGYNFTYNRSAGYS